MRYPPRRSPGLARTQLTPPETRSRREGGSRGKPAVSPAPNALSARPELGDPGCAPEPDPDRREADVEDEHPGHEREVPEGPPPDGDPLRPRGARCGIEARKLVDVRHDACRSCFRLSTSRITRCAVSSTESSVTSMTGQPSRRWIADASSSSS